MDCQDWKPVVLSKKSKPQPTPQKPKIESEEEKGHVVPPKMFDQAFGRKVEQLRNSKGWKRTDLAKRMNVKESLIESIEKGKEVYNGQLLHQLKKHLGNEL
jgi:ribosome-binding protein aMBF1 (putative translation factor)